MSSSVRSEPSSAASTSGISGTCSFSAARISTRLIESTPRSDSRSIPSSIMSDGYPVFSDTAARSATSRSTAGAAAGGGDAATAGAGGGVGSTLAAGIGAGAGILAAGHGRPARAA